MTTDISAARLETIRRDLEPTVNVAAGSTLIVAATPREGLLFAELTRVENIARELLAHIDAIARTATAPEREGVGDIRETRLTLLNMATSCNAGVGVGGTPENETFYKSAAELIRRLAALSAPEAEIRAEGLVQRVETLEKALTDAHAAMYFTLTESNGISDNNWHAKGMDYEADFPFASFWEALKMLNASYESAGATLYPDVRSDERSTIAHNHARSVSVGRGR